MKKKNGRPPLDDILRRGYPAKTMLNKPEAAVLLLKLEQSGLNTADFLREIIICGEVKTLRKERQAEHQELLDQRAHQHKVFIRIVIAIPVAALLILFSSGYLHYRNSSVYWGNRAYELATKQKAENPGALYQYVQENFSDSTKQEIINRIRNAERRLRKERNRK